MNHVSPGRPITDRQFECLVLAGQGLRNREIAQRLGISEYTVKEHMSRGMAAAGARNRRFLSLDQPEYRRVWVPQRIKQYRDAAGLTRAQLGARVFISPGSIGDFQSGVTIPRADMIAAIADALGRSVEDFYDVVPVDRPRRQP